MPVSQPERTQMDQQTMDKENNKPTADVSDLTLKECVRTAIDQFFELLDGQPASDLYDMVMSEVEAPLLEVVMKHTRDNQSKASEVLGLNRGTLRKKLKQYDLL